MVLKGNLIIVLNEPADQKVSLDFARAVMEFPQDCFIISGSFGKDSPVRDAVKELNHEAAATGMAFLFVEDFSDVFDLYKPEDVFFLDPSRKESFKPKPIVSALSKGHFVMLVFGKQPQGVERLGLDFQLSLPASVITVLYDIHKGVRKFEEGEFGEEEEAASPAASMR